MSPIATVQVLVVAAALVAAVAVQIVDPEVDIHSLSFAESAALADASPGIQCPRALTIACGASIDPRDTGMPVVEDSYAAVTHLDLLLQGPTPTQAEIVRRFVAGDAETSCTQSITVVADCQAMTDAVLSQIAEHPPADLRDLRTHLYNLALLDDDTRICSNAQVQEAVLPGCTRETVAFFSAIFDDVLSL